jgi:hypothetical protein
LILLFLCAAACGEAADFGAPLRLQPEQRPTIWDAPTKSRLGVREMAPPKPAVKFTATAPQGFAPVAASGQFRDLEWKVDGDDAIECYFAADVGGGVTGNIHRWYGQFGLPPVPPDGLPRVPFAGDPGSLLELSGSYRGSADFAMLLVFKNRGEAVTSLKMIGPMAKVAAARDRFLALAAAIRAGGATPAAGPPGGMPQASHGGGGQFTSAAPADWQAQTSGRELHHKFGAAGEVYVSAMGGSLSDHVNVYRQAMALPRLSDAEITALPRCAMLGGEGVWLDTTGSLGSRAGMRQIVALFDHGGGITAAKLVGTEPDVAGQLEAFRAFCTQLRRVQ